MPSNVVLTSGTGGFHTFATAGRADLDGAGLLAQTRELWTMKVRPGMRVLSVSPAWHALGLYESRALTEIGAVPVIPWGTLTPRFIGDMLTAVQKLQPEHLLITTRAVRMLFAECDRRGLDPREVFGSVRYVGCAGEPLSLPFRQYMTVRMDLDDVFERGGSGDGMFGGAECYAHRGHHISADVHYVEVVSPTTAEPMPEGRRGSAVVTNLSRGRSIYIRFDTEDVAEVVPGPCPCGRTHPVIEFHGRVADSVDVDGRLVTPSDVRMALDEIATTRFQQFSLAAEGEHLTVAIHGLENRARGEVEEAAETISNLLDLQVRLTGGAIHQSGWKGTRVGQLGATE